MPSIGPMELMIVLIIALVVFGPKKLPELGKSLGHGLKEFKSSVTGDGDDDDRSHLGEDAHRARLEATTAAAEPARTESPAGA